MGFPDSSVGKESNCNVRKMSQRSDRVPTSVLLGFSCGSASKESSCNAGGLGSIPGLGRSLGEGKGYPLQYSDLENSIDCIVHGPVFWPGEFQILIWIRTSYALIQKDTTIQRDHYLRKENIVYGHYLQFNKDHSIFTWFTHCIFLNTSKERELGKKYVCIYTHI